jgi:mannose-6-phosphate isomerase-like protein (cupin superfamily)
MNIVSKNNSLNHYQWGDQNRCDGWVLVEEAGLSVKLERLSPHTSEKMHVHRQSQQFFYILKGRAIFEIGSDRLELEANQGIHVQPGQKHRIMNNDDEDLEILLSSQPAVGNDRINED